MFSTLDPDGPGTKDRDDGFLVRFGVGADLYANADVALTLEASYVLPPGGNIDDMNYVSIGAGLTLRFYGLD